MTVENFAKLSGFEIVTMPSPDSLIEGAYVGDLLSWVMGKAGEGNIWVTIMTNKNVLAVAALIDVSCVIISENAEIDADFIETAADKKINVLRCTDDNYTVCAKLSRLLDE